MSLKLNGATSGSIELDVPAAIGSDVTGVLLPTTAGTLDRLERAGNILQVVTASTNTQVSSTTSSYVDTGLSASITPTSSSSKIIIIITQQANFFRTSGDQGLGIKVLRDSTEIYTNPRDAVGPFQLYRSVGSGANNFHLSVPIHLADTPNTTSQVTYKTQGRPYTTSDSGQVQFQSTGSVAGSSSHITLLEVSA